MVKRLSLERNKYEIEIYNSTVAIKEVRDKSKKN